MKDISQNANYQEFVRLLYEAYAASEEVDHFDLHSEDPVSTATWKALLEQQRQGFLALTEHTQSHATEIITWLRK